MNRSEFEFLLINTKALWEKRKKKDRIWVSENGISLEEKESYSYTSADTVPTGSDATVSLDLDPYCGVMYILDAVKEGILIFDLHTINSYWVDCLRIPNPKSIAVSDSDIYVAYDGKISCLARVNYQIRWKKEITVDIRIASSDRNYLYVLDVKNKKVFNADRKWNFSDSEIKLKDKKGDKYQLNNSVDIASDAENNIYILEDSKREIIKFSNDGTFIETIPITYKEDFIPLALALDIDGNIFLSFKKEKGIVPLKRLRKYETDGVYITEALDSTITECQWHKVVIEAERPENTQVRLYYYAANEQELPDNPLWSEPLVNPEDVLIQKAKGKNIWFKIELVSDDPGLNSPLIKSLKVYFPRLSYLRYLPATYQEDSASKDFLERFLSLFETFFSEVEEEIFAFPKYLDSLATPDEFVSWLSSWLAIAQSENLPLEKRRLLIKRAPQLYKKRGTRECLEELIEIYTGNKPIIVENFQLRCVENEDMKNTLKKLFGVPKPYNFCVLLSPSQKEIESQRKTIERIIELEKPAHTSAGVVVLQPWIYLDMHTYLGINTYLSKPVMRLGITSVISRDTVLTDREEAGQIERRARIDMDTKLT